MVIGHQLILNFLQSSLKKNRLAHAYLFSGPAHLGKKKVASEFVKMLLGSEVDQKNSADFFIIKPLVEEKKDQKRELEISIDQIRQIKNKISLSTQTAEYKIVLIEQADKMTRQAANALLKTLEEPTRKTILILISNSPQLVLATISSRCQLIKFLPVKAKEINLALQKKFKESPEKIEQAVRLASGRPGLAISYLEDDSILNEQNSIMTDLENLISADLNKRYQYVEKMAKDIRSAKNVLETWLLYFRDFILINLNQKELVVSERVEKFYPKVKNIYSLNHCHQIIKSIKKTNLLLNNSSLNARLALETLVLEL